MGNTFTQMIDIPNEMANAGRDMVGTLGEDMIFGPTYPHNFLTNPVSAAVMPAMPEIHNMPQNTLLPKQRDIQDNFSTSQQYSARFGVSQNHF